MTVSLDWSELAGKDLAELSTLLEILAFRAIETPEKEAVIFEGQSLSFDRLWNELNRVASFLIRLGIVEGDRIVLMMPNGLEFFSVFYGILRAGAIAVPIYPQSGEERVLSITKVCEARALFVPSSSVAKVFEQYQEVLIATNTQLFWLEDCLSATLEFSYVQTRYPNVSADTIAFFQYSSGSTGASKGVMLSHGNLVANLRQMVRASKMSELDVVVSWLPIFHDLGLILLTMAPFYVGARLVLLPTTLTKMSRWLETISQYRGTYTAAPDIGYRQLIKQIREPEKYDLSSLRVAINAAEPVRAQTIYEFERMFGLTHIVKPAYGLAEASVGVAFWGLDSKPIKVDAHGHVAIGVPLPEVELKIVSDGREAAVGEVGELVFKSPSGTKGYFQNDEANAGLFWSDFIRTGDLAYQDSDGDIFLVSRIKSLIKQGGRSISPREVEEYVDRLESIRMSAAIGIDRGDLAGEQLCVFVEARLPFDAFEQAASDLLRSIVELVHRQLGFRPGRVFIVDKGTIPYTANGKLQHALLKERFLAGELDESILYPKERTK